MTKRLSDFDVATILEESADDDFSSGSEDEYVPASEIDKENENDSSDENSNEKQMKWTYE